MMELVNVTGHAITLVRPDGTRYSLRPSSSIARVEKQRLVVAEADEWPIRYLDEVGIIGLPVPREGVLFVASGIVARVAVSLGRSDVIAPDTSRESAVRDGRGQVQAVRGFWAYTPAVAA